jgi:TolA-binding protein
MKQKGLHTDKKRGQKPGENSWYDSDFDRMLSADDSALFSNIGDYMKGLSDLEEVRNDPGLQKVKGEVKEMISDYRVKGTKSGSNVNFIKNSLEEIRDDKKIQEEIKGIKFESAKKDLDKVTVEWVKEWHERKQHPESKNRKQEEISSFIKSSLETENGQPQSQPEISRPEKIEKRSGRTIMLRYISLSAAAVIAGFFLINSLLPSSDPGKLYKSYYTPFSVVSTVTRGVTVTDKDSYSSALEKYRLGDYPGAVTGFSEILQKEPSRTTAGFFLGMSNMELGNYQKAAGQLAVVAQNSNDYQKEARWYLGLAYLKTGEKEKAVSCFRELSESEGFYRERAEKILRRLK